MGRGEKFVSTYPYPESPYGDVITKFSRMDSVPNFITHGAPLRALRARRGPAVNVVENSFAGDQRYRA